jgi:hypothetical protein
MAEKNMDSPEAKGKRGKREFLVQVTNQETQILLKQFALSKGMRAYIPPGSRIRIVLDAREEEVRAILKEVSVLAVLLEKRRTEMLEKFLKEHGLEVPLEVETQLRVLELKTAAALGMPLPDGRITNPRRN